MRRLCRICGLGPTEDGPTMEDPTAELMSRAIGNYTWQQYRFSLLEKST